jgi:protein phosphatase
MSHLTSPGGDKEITAKLEARELWEGWARKADGKLGWIPVISFGAKTDLGCVRENNEDKYDFFLPDDPVVLATKGMFFAVCDGMGGHAAGQIASELTLKLTIKAYYSDPNQNVEESLASAIKAANRYVYDVGSSIPSRTGMGTTITSCVLIGEEMVIGQVGDSRAYLLRDDRLDQLTQDHSWVNEQVRLGAMSREEAEMSPYRNVITRSIGNLPELEVDTYRATLKTGDTILLCTDGLTGMVEDSEIERILRDSSGPSSAALSLVDRALDNGGNDNVTCLILAICGFQELEAAQAFAESEPLQAEHVAKPRKLFGLLGRHRA